MCSNSIIFGTILVDTKMHSVTFIYVAQGGQCLSEYRVDKPWRGTLSANLYKLFIYKVSAKSTMSVLDSVYRLLNR